MYCHTLCTVPWILGPWFDFLRNGTSRLSCIRQMGSAITRRRGYYYALRTSRPSSLDVSPRFPPNRNIHHSSPLALAMMTPCYGSPVTPSWFMIRDCEILILYSRCACRFYIFLVTVLIMKSPRLDLLTHSFGCARCMSYTGHGDKPHLPFLPLAPFRNTRDLGSTHFTSSHQHTLGLGKQNRSSNKASRENNVTRYEFIFTA